jgi:hypothetical protein
MKDPNQEIEYLKEAIADKQEKLIGDILNQINIYEIKDIEFNEMRKLLILYSSETFRLLKAIESQEIIEKVLTSRLK